VKYTVNGVPVPLQASPEVSHPCVPGDCDTSKYIIKVHGEGVGVFVCVGVMVGVAVLVGVLLCVG
jgi:hypothetical protein